MMIFIRSQISLMAAMIAGSSTVQMAETCSWMMGKFRPPRLVSSPSATVSGSSEGMIFPAASDRAASSAPAGSAAMTRGVRNQGLHRQRGSRQQAAAAHRGHDHIEIGHLLQQFQRRGPLSGDDPVIVVGMDEYRPGAHDHLGEGFFAGLQGRFAGDDLRPIALHGGPLDRRRAWTA